MNRAVLIAGPTASGKSALALRLPSARAAPSSTPTRCRSIAIFACSRRGRRPEEESRAPHLLYGHVDAAEHYSVGRWLADASRALSEIERAGRLPIFVGGTGLYFRALTWGLSSMPPVPEAVRAKVRGEADSVAAAELHARLAARDPATAAKLRPSDRQRIIRALEIFEATGRPLAEWQASPGKPLIEPGQAISVFLAVERTELRRRIDARFDKMLAEGALEEVRAFAARKLDPALPAMKAHGAPWLMKHLAGEVSLEAAANEAKADTRKYAKRQETWFRHQLPQFKWLAPGEALEKVLLRRV